MVDEAAQQGGAGGADRRGGGAVESAGVGGAGGRGIDKAALTRADLVEAIGAQLPVSFGDDRRAAGGGMRWRASRRGR